MYVGGDSAGSMETLCDNVYNDKKNTLHKA